MPFSLSFSAGRSRFGLRRLLVFVSLVAAALATGCHARPVAPAATLTPARSFAGSAPAVEQVQSSPLYQQARQDCTRHEYRQAADLLQTLARTPGLAPEAVAFVERQRALCLKDAGLLPAPSAVPALPAAPALTPADADCGPRALLLVCRQLGVKTDLQTLRHLAGTTAQGTTMAGLQQAAQRLGLKAEGVQVSREALPDVTLPALLWLHRNHYAVLTGLSGRGEQASASVRDPNKTNEETLLQEQILQQSGGYLLLIHR